MGAVTPWIIVPGPQWNKHSVDKHARAMVFAKMCNNGHLCVSPQVVVLPQDWSHRTYFWDRVRYWMSQHPGSVPYYPGSEKSHRSFQEHPNAQIIQAADKDAKEVFPGQQRPIIIPNMSIENEKDRLLFRKEAWCPILMELTVQSSTTVKLAGQTPMDYLKAAIHLSQTHLTGSLSTTILIDDKTIRSNAKEFDDIVVNQMEYGLVGINIWPCYGNNMAQLRWGAFPGNTASGSGSLANCNLYRNVEKTILRAPFLHLPRRTLEVMKPRRIHLVFSRFTTYKLKPTLLNQMGLFAALFLGI